MTSADHLKLVRRQLDSLNLLRLDGPLRPADQEAYRALCRQERVLLETMVTDDDEGTGIAFQHS